MDRLKKRRDFLKVQKGRRIHTGLFSVQALARGDSLPSRVGLTITKRVSAHAVRRNRIRRRLKEALRLLAPGPWDNGSDYVIVGRIEALSEPFSNLSRELANALGRASFRHSHDTSALQARKS